MRAKKQEGRVETEAAKVLIVDDHPIVRQGLAKLINEKTDLNVTGEASSPHEALDMIAKQPFDVAVVDLSLEHTSGIELIKEPKLLLCIAERYRRGGVAQRDRAVVHRRELRLAEFAEQGDQLLFVCADTLTQVIVERFATGSQLEITVLHKQLYATVACFAQKFKYHQIVSSTKSS